MKRDCLVYPSTIGVQSGALCSYTTSGRIRIFDDSNPLTVLADECSSSTMCVWYVSPLWKFNIGDYTTFAFMDEFSKWTPVSQQRFTSIVADFISKKILCIWSLSIVLLHFFLDRMMSG
jgi:hypothetical protein